MSTRLRFVYVVIICLVAAAYLAGNTCQAQDPPPEPGTPTAKSFHIGGIKIEAPHMPHLPPIKIPPIKIPPIEIPALPPIGHTTNKWDVRHNLENGWTVAYGKEVGYEEYYEFYKSIELSVATENPGPAITYLTYLLKESYDAMRKSAGEAFSQELQKIAQKELVAIMYDAIKHGRVRSITLPNLEVQLGMATYNRSETGVPLPNTYQPYLRFRFTTGAVGNVNNQPVYRWVAAFYNPNNAQIGYTLVLNGTVYTVSIPAQSNQVRFIDSANIPTFVITFNNGNGQNIEYHLNPRRLPPGAQMTLENSEPYRFGPDKEGRGWDLFRGGPSFRWAICIINPTQLQIGYELSMNQAYRAFNLGTNQTSTHWIDAPFEPTLRIKYDRDPGPGTVVTSFDLSSYKLEANVVVTGNNSKRFVFGQNPDGSVGLFNRK